MSRRVSVPHDWDDEYRDDSYEEDIHIRRRQHDLAPPVRRARSRSRGPAGVNVAIYEDHHSRSPSRGGRGYHEDDIQAAMREMRLRDELALERRERDRLDRERNRDRDRRDSRLPTQYDNYQDDMIRNVNWQLQEARRDKKDLEREIDRLAHDTRDNRRNSEQDLQLVRLKSKIARLQQQHEDEEREAAIKEAEKMALVRKRDQDQKEAEDRKRVVDQYDADQRKKAEEKKTLEAEVLAKHEREIEKKKKEEKELKEMFELKRIEEEKKKKDEEEMWIAKLAEKKRIEEEKKKAEDERAKEKMRETLRKSGLSEKEIEKLVNPEKHKHHHSHYESTRITIKGSDAKGIKFVKVSKKHIEPETLSHYDLPWNYAEDDDDAIIILRYMDKEDLEKLVKHTKYLRKKRKEETEIAVTERRGRDGKKQIVMTRRRTPSRSPMGRKESPKRVLKLWP